MQQSQFHLLKSRRFLPLFATQFLGAFNDNAYKQALVILVTYGLIRDRRHDPRVLITAAAGVFILPYLPVLGDRRATGRQAGKIAPDPVRQDHGDRGHGAGRGRLPAGQCLAADGVLFLMGTQSAFFGPLKYSILPDHLRENELVAGNALIETGTFLAILLGTIFGGMMIGVDGRRDDGRGR